MLAACRSKPDAPRPALDAAVAVAVAVAGPTVADAAIAAAEVAPDAGSTGVDAAVAAAPGPSARCRGVPAAATIDALPSHDGVRTFHAQLGTDDDARWLVFDGPRTCHVTAVGRADGRARGRFWPGQGELKAFVLRSSECDPQEPDLCPAVVGLRDDRGVMLDAIEACQVTMAPGLHRAAIFAGQDSLIVSCLGSTGWGLDELLVLLHVVDGALRIVLTTDGTSGDHGPSDACTGCTDLCWTWLDEPHWKVLERGATPRIQTQAPLPYLGVLDSEAEVAAVLAATRNLVTWRFDPGKGVFIVERRRFLETTRVHDQCAPYPPRSPLGR